MPDAETSRSPNETTKPIPPRYWWLKRIAVASGTLLIAVGVLRWQVGRVAEQRLQAKVTALRAAGEPLLPEDFSTAPVPDEENAALLLKKAVEALAAQPKDAPHPATVLSDPELIASPPEAVQRLLEANQEALRLLRAARAKPRVDWEHSLPRPWLMAKIPNAPGYQNLGEVGCVAALVHYHEGDQVAAFETLRDVLNLADRLNQGQSWLLTRLTGVVVSNVVVATVQHVIDAGVPDCSETRSLIAALLDDQTMREGLGNGFRFERAMLLYAVQYLVTSEPSGMLSRSPNVWQRIWAHAQLALLKPFYQLDAVRMLDGMTEQIDACRAPNVPAAMAPPANAVSFKFDSVLDRFAHSMSALLMPSFRGTIARSMEYTAARRLAAAALALRLYENDKGLLPATLDELVPDYLPHVPVDLCSANSEPILYVVSGSNSRVALRASGVTRRQPEARRDASLALPNEGRGFWIYGRLAPLQPGSAPTRGNSLQRANQRDDIEREPRNASGNQSSDYQP